ncbi:MAG TPA: serine hydrolase [Balneolaceae bacterium]|nr:serine hydrolase [Balneolaceae bacterium]
MKKPSLLLFLIISGFALIQCQRYDRSDFPAEDIQRLADNFNGDVGIFIMDLETGATFEMNADTLFPTASTIKIPIMIGIFNKIEQGDLSYDQILSYDGEHDDTWGNDLINQLKPGAEVELSKLVHLMMSTSNNTASLWNQHLAGSGTEINILMDSLGFEQTRVNSRTDGRQENREAYGWGQSTPGELAQMMRQIYSGEIISKAASEQMFRIMTRNYWDGEALSQIPPYINVASKNGAVSRSKSEVLLVNGPSGDYLFALMTKNQADAGYDDDNEGFQLLRDISDVLYHHFEPGDNWTSAR